jgi:FkbM family methyltransferase
MIRVCLAPACGKLSRMPSFRDYVPSIRTAIMPELVREFGQARELGVDLFTYRAMRAARLDLLPSVDLLRQGLIVDLGANVGDWTAAVLRVAPGAEIIAVEPAPEPRQALHRRFGGRITVDPRAVSSKAGIAPFHVTGHSHSASLRTPHPESDALYGVPGAWKVKETIEVETTTVDQLVAGRSVAVLKIDVQGAERDVLAGALDTLSRTRAVLLEVTFTSHYTGDTTFPWLHEHMLERAFELVGLSAPFVSSRNTVLWCDACYARP